MNLTIWKNFTEMPRLLQLIVVSGIVFPLFVVASIVRPSINVFGHDVSEVVWWSSGGGPFTVVIGFLMWFAAIRLLKRSVFGRLIYVTAWILMTISIPFVAVRLSMMSNEVVSASVSNLVVVVLLAFYLYRSKSVRNYFNAAACSFSPYIESDPIGLDGGINTYALGGYTPQNDSGSNECMCP